MGSTRERERERERERKKEETPKGRKTDRLLRENEEEILENHLYTRD
jgi:hypothetical protein